MISVDLGKDQARRHEVPQLIPLTVLRLHNTNYQGLPIMVKADQNLGCDRV